MALIDLKIEGVGSAFKTPDTRSAWTASRGRAANPRPAITAARTYSGCPRLRMFASS
jgi:hypothetical protein